MGTVSFQLVQRDRFPEELVERAYMADLEGTPVSARAAWEGDLLVFSRSSPESGHFHIPWRTGSHGEQVLTTGTLVQRRAPYLLAVELARGTLNRLTNQLHEWEMRGLETTDTVRQKLQEATGLLAGAATRQDTDPSGAEAQAVSALHYGLELVRSLVWNYTNQAYAVRRATQPNRFCLLGCMLGQGRMSPKQSEWFRRTFNMVNVPLGWRDAEENAGEWKWFQHDQQMDWAKEAGLRVCGGPLLSFDSSRFPDWLYLWEDDPSNLNAYVQRYIESVVRRYREQVQLWHCVSKINMRDALALDEDVRLNIAISAVNTLRQLDQETPVMISFDQPWGEYMSGAPNEPPPISFADAMLRMDLNVSILGVELNLGYWPRGTGLRDIIQIGRTIDHWGLLGLPVVVMLRAPGGVPAEDDRNNEAELPTGYGVNSPSPASQAGLVGDLVPHLLAKPYVQGVVWNQWSDEDRSRYPRSGLLNEKGEARQGLQTLFEIRKQFVDLSS